MTKWLIRVMTLLLAAVLLLTGCKSSVTPPDSDTGKPTDKPVEKDTFVFALTTEPGTLDAFMINDFNVYTISHNIYDNLVFEEPDGSLVPCLAESWDFSDTGDAVIFHLRKNVKFHNGEDFNADDVVFTFTKDIPSPQVQNLTGTMVSMEKIDEYTVQLNLKHPYGPVLAACSGSQLAIVDKETYEQNPDGYARNPIGTGPYKFIEWVGGDHIKLERFDGYWGPAPAIKTVTFQIIPDRTSAVLALEAGTVDMCGPGPGDRDHLMANPDITYYETEQLSTEFICMNNKRGLFSDKNMRMAMAYGIDRAAILQGAHNGVGVVCNTPMSGVFGRPENFDWYEYNPEKAKEYLALAGYPKGLTVTFTTMASAGFIKPTEIIQGQLREIGVEVVIDKIERAAFIDKVVANKDFEICFMSATAFVPDSDYLYPQYHSDPTEKGRNYHLCEIPELDECLEKGRMEQDPEKRKGYYYRVCEIFKEEAIQVPCAIGMASMATSAKLKGYVISPTRRVYVKDFYWEP